MRLSIALVPLLVLPLMAAGLPALSQSADTAATAPAEQLPAISVVALGTRHLQDHVVASGLVAPVETVYAAPLIEGQPIEALLADVGDTVRQGQVLARLSTATLDLQKAQLMASLASAQAAVAQAEAGLTSAQAQADEAARNADRTARLLAAGTAASAANDTAQAALTSALAQVAVATQSREAAKAQLALVQAQIDSVNLQLSRTRVVAPVAGLITARNAQLGAIASGAGGPMFTLIRDGALELRADVAEADLARLSVGQSVDVRLAASGVTLAGTVRLVEPTIDAITRLGHVRIGFTDASSVRSGMFAEARVLVAERDGLAAPITSVSTEGGRSFVMRVADGVVHRVAVTTGIRDGQWIEITEGLAPGDQIVAKAGAFVADGDRINAVPLATN